MDLIIEYKNKVLLAEEQKISLEKILHQYKVELLACNTVHDCGNIQHKRRGILKNSLSTDKEFQCCGDAKQCIGEYRNIRRDFESINNSIKKVINSTAQVTKTMEQMKTLIEDSKDKEHVYLKFMLDRNGELVGFILDYKNVFNFHSIATLYGVMGSRKFNEYSNRGRIYMFLEFHINSEQSCLEIIDFFVNLDKTRCYHGTLTLETLVEAVKVINRDIYIANNQNNKCKRAEILKIHGSIKPHEAYISRQDLYTFYEKNGFIEEGKLFKRISYHAVNGCIIN